MYHGIGHIVWDTPPNIPCPYLLVTPDGHHWRPVRTYSLEALPHWHLVSATETHTVRERAARILLYFVLFVHKSVITYRCEQFWWTFFIFKFPNWNPDPTHMSLGERGEFRSCLWHTLFRCLIVKTAPLNTLAWQMSTRQNCSSLPK